MSLFSAEKVTEVTRFWREMAPVPGRMEGALRFALTSALATLLLLIEQPAVGFIAPSLFMLFLISRDTPFHSFKDLFTLVSFAALGTGTALLMIMVTGNNPVARVLGVAIFTFLATFFFRASTIPLGALAYGCLTFMTISLWDYQIRPEKILHLSLWPIGTLATVAGSGIAVEYLLNRSDPLFALRREIKARCTVLEQLFRLCAAHADTKQLEKQSAIVRRYAVTGEGQLQVLLERVSKRNSCSNTEFRNLRIITLMLDRLLMLGVGFAIHNDLGTIDPAQLERVSSAIAEVGEGRLEEVNQILADCHTPLPRGLDQIAQTLRHGWESRESTATERPRALPPGRSRKNPFRSLFLPDAFTNHDYFMYAFKLSVCATICYVFYNAVKWPQISSAIFFTVYFTGLSTTGASNRKILFRMIGSALGGLILGIGCLVFVFPNIEGVTGFLVIIAVLAFIGAWIGASPYFGYIGLQTTYAFNLLAFERLSTPDQMQPARDRLLAIAIAFVVMFFIFHKVRPERTVDTMRHLLARMLRAEAELVRLFDTEPNADRDDRVTEVRKQIAAVVVNLQSFSDVVKFEFPPDRAADMRISNEILNAVSNATNLLLDVSSWPHEFDQDEQQTRLKEIRNELQVGLRNMAGWLEQLSDAEQPTLQETVLGKLRGMDPEPVAKTLDRYRELKMICDGIVRAAA